jgi:hypothetical protein
MTGKASEPRQAQPPGVFRFMRRGLVMRTYDKLIAHIRERRSPARSRPRYGVISHIPSQHR